MGSKQKQVSELTKFVWKRDPDYDLGLLYETEAQNPFALNNQKPKWMEIAKVLQDGPLKMKVTHRSCRERVSELLKVHRREENESSLASGIEEEEMTEFKKLITNVANLEAVKPDKQLKSLYSKKDKAEGENLRSQALEDLNSRYGRDDDQEERDFILRCKRQLDKPKSDNDDDNDDNDEDFDFSARKKRNFNRPNPKKELINFLEKKSENENTLREEELRIRKMEVETKSAEVEIMRIKTNAEIAEKKKSAEFNEKKVEAEIAERKSMTEFLVKLASSLLKE